ncbi:MAG: hypothetical protein ACI8RP_001929 [Urechidicola sp.]|jgi:hypothetical protein
MSKIYLAVVIVTFFGSMDSCSKKNERKISNHKCEEETIDIASQGVGFMGYDNDSALFYLKKAEELDSFCFNVNYHLIIVYSGLNDYKNAFIVNKRFLFYEPDNPQYLMRAAVFSRFLNNEDDEELYLRLASKSYERYDFNNFYEGNDEINKVMYKVELEICNLLLGDKTAMDRMNKLIDDDSNGLFDRDIFYNLTPEKYYKFLQTGYN